MVGPALAEVLAAEAAERQASWQAFRGRWGPEASDAELAALLLDEADLHVWRLVDAALARLSCAACDTELGGGSRGCPACDRADGFRLAAREPDRRAVPPGNEHAIRVAVTLVRFPHRWPAGAVEGARLYLPLFAAGDMPTKAERYALLRALRAGRAGELAGAPTFSDMAARTGYL